MLCKITINPCSPIVIRCWLQEWKCSETLPRFVKNIYTHVILFPFLWRMLWYDYISCVFMQLIAPNTIEELYSTVNRSPARRYFMIVGFSLVGVIFIIGLFCGRVTRRTMIMKNKWRRRGSSTSEMAFVRLVEGLWT